MQKKIVAPFGTWDSPVTSDLIVQGGLRLHGPVMDGGCIYWGEGRPSEGGRNAIAGFDGRTIRDLLPGPYNARSRVHEYGGGAFAIRDGLLVFVEMKDQRVYKSGQDGAPAPLTPEGGWRYGDFVFDTARDRVICVCECHDADGREPANLLVSVGLSGEAPPRVLAQGEDFYSSPRISPDGRYLAWLTWSHPDMPWDSTRLWLAEIRADGRPVNTRCVAGGPGVSVCFPEWSPDGALHFVSDRSGFWNIYRLDGGEHRALCAMDAEFGRPLWVLGESLYSFDSKGRIICAYCRHGVWSVGAIPASGGDVVPFDLPFTDIDGLRVEGDQAVMIAGGPCDPPAVVLLDLVSGRHQVVQRSNPYEQDSASISRAEALSYPGSGGETAHAFFYQPASADHEAPELEKPPLLVMSHGGPTSAAGSGYQLRIQYWTSRGFAVLDVNYGGSTGYGRAYRGRLEGAWGVVDVEDCIAGAKHLVQAGRADGRRLAISGGSAGGYTTLCALTFHDLFRAGASRYGVGDLEALARDTHKFESRYLDRLVGPYPGKAALYRRRSPIHHAKRLSCPVIFFQGLEDKVVPPSQSEAMVMALRAAKVPVAYVTFEGEQHGFRKAASIRRALDGELYFYGRIFGFRPAGDLEPVAIMNL